MAGVSDLLNFNNPQFLGLLSGLSQASMPSRLPVPMGAAIGGASQGLMQGQQFGLQQAQGKQALAQGQQAITQGNIGLQQSVAALNYWRQQNGMAPISLADMSGATGTGKSAFGLSSQNPTDAPPTPPAPPGPTDLTAAPAAPSPIAPPPPASLSPVQGTPDASAPRAVRNNNPLNLTTLPSGTWTGQVGKDGQFAVFDNPQSGLAAADQNLHAYYSKHGLDTLQGVISRWAPASENDTAAYVGTVAKDLGIDPNAKLNLSDPATRHAVLASMAKVEAGGSPQPQGGGITLGGSQSASSAPQPPGPIATAGNAPDEGQVAMQHIMNQINQLGLIDPKAAMAMKEKLFEPANLRQGGTLTVYDPVVGKFVKVAHAPILPEGSEESNGQVAMIPGAPAAIAQSQAAKTAGTKSAELQYQPQIEAGVAAAKKAVENQMSTIEVVDNQTQQKVFTTPQAVLNQQGRYTPVTDGAGNPVAAPTPKTTTGVVIPPPPVIQGRPKFAAGPSPGDVAQAKAGEDLVKTWTDGLPNNIQAEQRMLAMADAMKSIQTGAWASQKAEIGRHLIAAGVDPKLVGTITQADPAQAQIIVKNNFGAAMTSLKGITNRVTQNEIFAASKNLSNPSLEPAANLAIMAQGVGVSRQTQALAHDWQAARTAGWTDPLAFQDWWLNQPANKLQSFIDTAAKEIGPLKGMEGTGSLPAGARMQLKANQVTTFGNGQKWTLGPNGQPVQVH